MSHCPPSSRSPRWWPQGSSRAVSMRVGLAQWGGILAIAIGVQGIPAIAPALAQDDLFEVSLPADVANDGSYFADVLVRGQPVFQVGSLNAIGAAERAAIVNRRIASVLTSTDGAIPALEVVETRGASTLRVNNRVLMTVTDQDAEDFGTDRATLARRRADRLSEAFVQPPLWVDVSQRVNGTVRQLGQDAIASLPSLLGGALVVLVTWGTAATVRHIAFRWAQRTEGDRSSEILIGRLCYGGVWVVGSAIALGVAGLDFGALLGALGLTSVAIGFSLKDVLSNYISGVILLAARPFRLKDQIAIGDYEGTVTQIQLRATTLQTYDGRTVYIPNQEVFQASIINNTAAASIRSSVVVGIDYDAEIGSAIATIVQALATIPAIQQRDPAPPKVLVRELAASTVNLEVRFWVDSRRAEFLDTTSQAARAIKEALQQARIDMPTEIYTLVFRNSPTPPG
ncbi:MAG: mechanosensitive ion channel family protein [Cyanobacteria bacterium J06639_1]